MLELWISIGSYPAKDVTFSQGKALFGIGIRFRCVATRDFHCTYLRTSGYKIINVLTLFLPSTETCHVDFRCTKWCFTFLFHISFHLPAVSPLWFCPRRPSSPSPGAVLTRRTHRQGTGTACWAPCRTDSQLAAKVDTRRWVGTNLYVTRLWFFCDLVMSRLGCRAEDNFMNYNVSEVKASVTIGEAIGWRRW